MQIQSFIKHKHEVVHVYDDFTVAQALETMKKVRFTSIPVLSRDGTYVGTLTEGDLLWDILSAKGRDAKTGFKRLVKHVKRQRDYAVISAQAEITELIAKASEENFVPVVDEYGQFIGIITRKTILNYFFEHNFIVL